MSSQPTQVSIDPSEVLRYQLRRHTTLLFKEYLTIIEQLTEEHDEALEKLYNSLPEEFKSYVGLADYLTESKFDRLRRSILTRGNDTIRAMDEEIAKYNVEFKK